jgi:hypothetical protein
MLNSLAYELCSVATHVGMQRVKRVEARLANTTLLLYSLDRVSKLCSASIGD